MKYLFELFTLIFFILMFSCTSEDPESLCSDTPILTMGTVSKVTHSSAFLTGKIIAPTCDPIVIEQGFIYLFFSETELIFPKRIEVEGENISIEIDSLFPNTTYEVRTYFRNDEDLFMGYIVVFITDIGPVNISTKVIKYDGVDFHVWSGGYVTDDGGAEIISKGVCWSTTANPTISDNKTIDGSGKGEFDSELFDLIEGTTYFVRAYSTNYMGTTYGNEISFIKLEFN